MTGVQTCALPIYAKLKVENDILLKRKDKYKKERNYFKKTNEELLKQIQLLKQQLEQKNKIESDDDNDDNSSVYSASTYDNVSVSSKDHDELDKMINNLNEKIK